MAQTFPVFKIMCQTLPCQNTASQSTALLLSIQDDLRSSSFLGSRDSGEMMKNHRIRVLPGSRIRLVTESQLCRTDQSCKLIGSNLRSLAATESHVFVRDSRILNSKSAQGRVSTAVHASAMPRILPGAGPLRDFLFAFIGAVLSFLFAGVLARVWCLEERYFRATSAERGTATMPEMGSNQGQKESVEWVNMVIHKVWKVYRRSLEVWLVQLLQPAIDNLGKPNWVKRVKIVELNLDYEPIIVRNVQRRASRRANDLQYHFGLRYAGGARCLLNLKLGRAGLETSIPVGVYDLDVDAELWVKLRLAPVKPYVGTLSLAFVRLPTIKLVLAPFRVVNLFSIPFLNNFLSKLLTVDLPRLLVLPRHITFDFLPQGQNVMDSMEAMEASVESGAMDESIASGVLDLLKTASTEPAAPQDDPSEAFVGELSVTICDARDLPIRGFTGWSNPYCILTLGDQVLESKRNKETSHPSGHKDPVWNQDFLLLVEDPRRQRLMLRVRDSTMTLNPNIGYCQINLAELQDCVPRTMWVNLKRDGPFGPKKVPGRVRVALTYKSYVDKEEEDIDEKEASSPYIKVYGDSGADSVEDVGVSIGEEARAERPSGIESDDDSETVSVPREGASVEVTTSPKEKKPSSFEEEKAYSNGNARVTETHSKRSVDSERVKPGNGAALRREQPDSHSTDSSDTDSSDEEFSFPRGFGHNGDVRVPRGIMEDLLDRELESLATRSSDAQEGSGRFQSWRRSSQGTYSEPNGSPSDDHAAFPTRPDEKDESFRFENEAELGSEEKSSADLAPKTEGNKLLWLCMFTTVAYIIGCSLHLSNPLHP
ncbi:hypothetical protein M758_5G016500 [Ceratodon purpureus]|nr:hypothetical protein M758_5G016500 [Ceratodon purpureus]